MIQLYLRADQQVRRFTRRPAFAQKRRYGHVPTAEDILKAEAYHVVLQAKRFGWLKREPCAICGSPKSEGHHDDYTKPLRVRWLCRLHHRQAHRGPRKRTAFTQITVRRRA